MRVSRLLSYFVDRPARLFEAHLTSLLIGTLSPSTGIKDTQEYVIWSIRYELNGVSKKFASNNESSFYSSCKIQFVMRDDFILNVGCGNSRLTEEMFEDG